VWRQPGRAALRQINSLPVAAGPAPHCALRAAACCAPRVPRAG